jgi:hypothetical protein
MYEAAFDQEWFPFGTCDRFIDRTKVVEVVRCKDCKHFVQGEPYDPCECMKWKVKFGVAYTTPDGYCHKAERKDENP